VWINRDQITFTGVPAFYRVAANRKLEEIATPAVRLRHQIGVHYLRLGTARPAPAGEVAQFREGLLRNKERLDLYSSEPGEVRFLGPRLFSTRFQLPANVPPGAYSAEVLLVRNGEVIAAQRTPMFVSRTGLNAEVFEFAHRQSAAYGILAVLIAALSGWGAGVIFRKA
jgi:uncharacterized protein (TIGR02186 family)